MSTKNNNHDPSTPLANSRHESFALAWAKGSSAADSLRAAGYADIPANAHRMTKNDAIRKRKEWLQSQTATGATMSGAEKREILAVIARNPTERASDRIAAVRADNDLAGEGSEAGAQGALSAMAEQLAKIRALPRS
jgi:hypothetical protein